MCGRFYMEPDDPVIRDFMEQVNRSPIAGVFHARFGQSPAAGEIAPAAVVPVLAFSRCGSRAVFPLRWGFSLPAASGRPASRPVINARAETAGEKPLFRDAWKEHRCVIPASRYFEWEHTLLPNGKKKTGAKYAIRPADGSIVWLAGLYRLEDSLPVFVVLTREAAPTVSRIHDRMPLILPEDAAGEWIRPDADPARLLLQARTEMACSLAG